MSDNAQHAEHLALISYDLRAAGDVALLRLSEDGVSEASFSLADELWMIAANLDWDTAMRVSHERRERSA